MEEILYEVIRIMSDKYKLNIHDYDESFVIDMLKKRMVVLNFTRFSEYKYFLNSNEDEAIKLNESLLIQFSEFFRDSISYAILEKKILPELMLSKKEGDTIRIWSTSCSTGEEAYTLAMMVKDSFEVNKKKLKVNIFATDIDHKVIGIAKEAIYEQVKMDRVPFKYVNKYFTKYGHMFHVNQEIRKMVTFSVHDLLDLNTTTPAVSIYGDFDIIMCNNVVYYYNGLNQIKIMKKLKKALKSSGYILTDGVSLKTMNNQTMIKQYQVELPIIQIKDK